MSWVEYPLTMGNARSTNRYELHVLLDNKDAEGGKSWWVWSNQKNLRAIQLLKKKLEHPFAGRKYGYGDGPMICRIVTVYESRWLFGDPTFALQENPDAPNQQQPARSAHKKSNIAVLLD